MTVHLRVKKIKTGHPFWLSDVSTVVLTYRMAHMFSFLKSNPSKKLRKQYDRKLEEGMLAQRRGDMRAYAKLTEEAEAIWKEIKALEQ